MTYRILKMSTGEYGVWLETKLDYLKCLAVYLPYREAQKFVKQHKAAAE
jgi:hypothetical protein